MTRTAEICAHRGESWGHLENTLAAFQAAIDGGATCVELDVRVTADGVPVVVHDQTLARIWGVPRRVDELGWEQVAALRSAGERIPSLAEALDLFVDGRSDVLIDVTSAAIADLAFTVVREHPARAHTRWCGATEAMRAVRALDPDATVYLAAEGVGDAELEQQVAELRPTYLNSPGDELVPADVARCHALGLKLSVWTIDDAGAMQLLIALGTDSITTNRMGLLRRVNELAAADHPADPVDPSLTRARDVALALAGFAVRRAAAGPGRIDAKPAARAGDDEVVTDVDVDIETRVREVIGAAFPKHAVVGEEAGGEPAEWTWFCDPVDGTTNFAAGLGISAFSLCLVHNGAPVVGVVANLLTGEIVDAVAGGGVRVAGLPWTRLDARLDGGVVLTELAGLRRWPGQAELEDAAAEAGACVRVLGSGTWSTTQAALGRAAVCVIDAFHSLDHGAAALVAAELGCWHGALDTGASVPADGPPPGGVSTGGTPTDGTRRLPERRPFAVGSSEHVAHLTRRLRNPKESR